MTSTVQRHLMELQNLAADLKGKDRPAELAVERGIEAIYASTPRRMEEAPRDGTVVLIFHGEWFEGKFDGKEWVRAHGPWANGSWGVSDWPDAWMPCPPRPHYFIEALEDRRAGRRPYPPVV